MKYVPPLNGDTTNANRSYVNADVNTATPGSIPKAEVFEHPMREILNVITAAGLVPDQNDLTQLFQAISLIIAGSGIPDASETVKGKVELATGAEALGGTDAVRAVTSAALASSKSIAANGYYKLPGGLLLQWGISPNNVNTTVVGNFPIAFPNQCLRMFGSQYGVSQPPYTIAYEPISATQYNYRNAAPVNIGAIFLALGY